MSGTNDDKDKNKNVKPNPGGEGGEGGSGNGEAGGNEGAEGSENLNPGGEGQGTDEFDYSDPEKVQKELKKLRKENASRRVSSKEANEKLAKMEETQKKLKVALGLEEEDDPAEQVESLRSQNEALQMEIQLNSIASELEIPAKGQKYFKFLIHDRLSELEEGEELSDEDLAEIAKEVKGMGGNAPSSTGVNSGGQGGGGKAPSKGDEMTVEQFGQMSLTEKSALYQKNPKEYERLFSAAKEKGLV
jgi:hypothetical protein